MKKRHFLLVMLVLAIMAVYFVSCDMLPPEATASGLEFNCELYGSLRLTKIIVKRGDETIAKLKIDKISKKAADVEIEFIDLNFDGHEDIRIIFSKTTAGTKYKNWIWSREQNRFITDSRLDSLISPVFDSKSKTISAKYKTRTIDPAVGTEPETYILEAGSIDYQWRSGVLLPIKKECTTYYSESEIYCVAVWETDDGGELVPVSERWLLPYQYEREGYLPIE